MTSRIRQYIDEIRTCYRVAACTSDFVRLVARTEEFHLTNLLRGAGSQPVAAPEKHRINIGGCPRDLWIRPRSGDVFIFHEVFTNQCYRIPTAILPQARTILDLGANIGMTTLFLAQFFPRARYVCVEPSPFNALLLRHNVEWLGERVSVVESAVADFSGNVSFTDSNWSWGGHIDSRTAGTRTVSCLTVGDIIESHQLKFVDLLKVDIEGAEKLLFSSRPAWLKKVGCIVIELHDGYSFSQFEHDVRPLGFTALPEGSPFGNVMKVAVAEGRFDGGWETTN